MADKMRTIHRDSDTQVDIYQHESSFLIRTPNATVTITVQHDRGGNDLTTVTMVSDDPYTVEPAYNGNDCALMVFTRHPATVDSAGEP